MRWSSVLIGTAVAFKASPVSKVVELLRELKSNLENDDKVETKIYNKYSCWCSETTDRKIKAISTNKETIKTSTNIILLRQGTMATLKAEIAELQKRIAANQAEQVDLTNVRQKENAQWQYEKDETEEALGAMQKAIEVLEGAGTKTQLISVAKTVRSVMRNAPDSAFDPRMLSKLDAFTTSLMQTGYAPQSASVQGILKDMYLTFASNLQSSTIAEGNKQKHYEANMKTLDELIQDQQFTVREKEGLHATAQEEHAAATQLRTSTIDELAENEKFFAATDAACHQKAQDWNTRKNLRADELKGIDEAIKILSDDKARSTFTKAQDTFIQLALPQHRQQLSAIAVMMRTGGHFDDVVKSIDAMMKTLREEQQQDILDRDRCIKERHEHREERDQLLWEMKRLKHKEAALVSKKETLESHVEQNAEDAKAQKAALKEALENRNTANAAWQEAVRVDTESIKLLEDAVKALRKFYKNKTEPTDALLQDDPEFEISEDEAPEADLSADYTGRTKQSTGILTILAQIIEDLKDDIKESTAEEKKEQVAFEGLSATGRSTLQDLHAQKVQLNADISKTQGHITKTIETHDNTETSKNTEVDILKTMKKSCDYIEGTFHDRRKARDVEMRGLEEAKEYLSGAAEQAQSEFTQVGESADDEDASEEEDAADDEEEEEPDMAFLQRRF